MNRRRRTVHAIVDTAIVLAVVAAIAGAVLSMPSGPSPEQVRHTADSVAAARADSIAAERQQRARRRAERDSIAASRRHHFNPERPSPLDRPVNSSRPSP